MFWLPSSFIHTGCLPPIPEPLAKWNSTLWTGAYLGFCQGGCTFLADLPPSPPSPPPGSGSGSGSASRFWAGCGSALKQCGSTALGSTVKILLSNFYLCLGKNLHFFLLHTAWSFLIISLSGWGGRGCTWPGGGMHRGGGGMHVHPVHPPWVRPWLWTLWICLTCPKLSASSGISDRVL